MQADNQPPEAERRGYKNFFDAFKRIRAEEGTLGLWRGATPTVIRAMVLNLAMLASYDEVKEQVMHFLDQKETLEVRIL